MSKNTKLKELAYQKEQGFIKIDTKKAHFNKVKKARRKMDKIQKASKKINRGK